ncbi:protein shortage in chiasmata 1 ortholog isoform X2 [Gouania willdenowi]|uniref:protein shortage in chiasmata 1 ortholog isoform X2 n=1 Tax=Gouania willdenowi TaxID=441366 RepID=UPI0010552619|nr:protein shortage in chiasmata 1 ortholog isoform X2 [Gouania willdenowi]
MSVKDRCAPAQTFPVIRFKALNYVFESSTSLKVLMNLLALPPPYLADTSDLYPHSGKLSEVTYRTPWVRENVISSCKIFISGSVLEDLRTTKLPVDLPERFIVTDEKSDTVGHQNKECSISDPWQEVFSKWTLEPMKPERSIKDLRLEELVSVDHLSQFKGHLPKLEATLSRLRMLPIEDPLLNSAGKPITEDAMFSCFKRCESYEKTSDVETKNREIFTNCEKFVKESLDKENLLLLSPIVDMPQPISDNLTAFSTIRGQCSISPEHLDEKHTIQEVLQTAFPSNYQSMDICPYDLSEKADKGDTVNECLFDSHSAEHVMLPSEMELDLPITPTLKSSQLNGFPSTSELLQEPMSPLAKLSLVSARAQEEMTMALWKAEKHPPFEVRFMLAEPHVIGPAVDFKPLADAMEAFKLQRVSLTDDLPDQCDTVTGVLQQVWGSNRDFKESLETCSSSIGKESMEDFQKLPLTHVDVGSLTLNFPEKTPPVNFASQKSVNIPTISSNGKEKEPDATTSTEEVLNEGPSGSSAHTNIINSVRRQAQLRSEGGHNSRALNTDQRRTQQPERDHDPLSAFLSLRSQQAAAESATPQSPATSAESVQLKQQTVEHIQTPGRRPAAALGTIVTGSATREQEVTEQMMPEEKPDSTVVQVQATDSQQQAFCELLAFAQPCLKAAKKLGLNFPMWVDFSSLAPDQTHFLLKQQERALYRTAEGSPKLLQDQELLFNQAALIHVLVTFKELLLKCDLEYLTKAAETCEEPSLKQLLRRLNIVLHLSEKKEESNFKLLKMQQLLSEQLHSRNGLNITQKILVIMSVDSDESRSLIINGLKLVTDLNVTAVFPKDGDKKLCGASVVSSVQNSACVVVYEQHIGPDFPWTCFSLVVEFDHPGPSPWSKLCKERNISHFSFNTSIPDTEDWKSPWCLEDSIPYVVFVTEGLLNCPLLLQTLESSYNVTVLERSYCPSLQMLGSTNNYSVVTVDESTAIIIQDQGELSQDRVSDALVMRLTAVSLQYSHCWLILYCPDSQGGGFSSEAFSSLVLVYSSLVLFGMSDNLHVKVLIVWDVLELAKWIRQICFHSLMSSNKDSLSYLDRDWLSVMPSEDEMCLSQFHCINPLVSQLMLHKAPSLKWLLGASLSQLKELFPEVPHKVLKLFTDTTSLYQLQPDVTETKPISPLKDLWTQNINPECSPKPKLLQDISHLFGAASAEGVFGEHEAYATVTNGSTDFRMNPSPSFASSQVSLQESWTGSDPWRPDDKETLWSKLPGWKSRAKAFGRDVQRTSDEHIATSSLYTPNSPFELDSSWQEPMANQKYSGPTLYSELQHPSCPSALSLPAPATWSHGLVKSERMNEAAAVNGSRCWRGQERKRSPEDARLVRTVLTPLKKGRLSYERVPGRSDGQTRLRLF